MEEMEIILEPNAYSANPQTDEDYNCIVKFQNVSASFPDEESFCPAVWDSLYCWPPTASGTAIYVPCEDIIPIFAEDSQAEQQGFAYRDCDFNGRWIGNWTNYTDCMDILQNQMTKSLVSPVMVSYIIFICSLVSLVSLVVSLFIFSYFKSLQCSRIRVHRNLVISLLLHSLMMMTISLPGIFEHVIEGLRDANWFCKAILAVKMYSAMTCIYWMFVEGHLLHSSITVSVFRSESSFAVYYGIGWGIPLLCVLSWVILMAETSTTQCWRGYGKSPFIWLITGPMILALMVNTGFLVNIIRILITKLRMSVSVETKQVRKAIKATALLFPLLGITHLLFCINPRDDAHLELAYMITNAILQSSQGLFVAILYCFLNSEVQSVLLHAYARASMRRHPDRVSRASRILGPMTNTTSMSHSTENVNGIWKKSPPCKRIMIPLQPVEEEDSNREKESLMFNKETAFN